jgi:hypothetical protein
VEQGVRGESGGGVIFITVIEKRSRVNVSR